MCTGLIGMPAMRFHIARIKGKQKLMHTQVCGALIIKQHPDWSKTITRKTILSTQYSHLHGKLVRQPQKPTQNASFPHLQVQVQNN